MNLIFGGAIFYIIPVVIFGAGIYYVLYPQYLAWRWGKKSRQWPFVYGKITYSGIKSYYSERSGRSYQPKVEYEYTVDHKHYKSKRIEFGIQFNTFKSEAQKTAAEYNIGKQVTVHYNPGNPRLATLKTGISAGRLAFGCVLSAIIGGLGLAWAVGMLRSII